MTRSDRLARAWQANLDLVRSAAAEHPGTPLVVVLGEPIQMELSYSVRVCVPKGAAMLAPTPDPAPDATAVERVLTGPRSIAVSAS